MKKIEMTDTKNYLVKKNENLLFIRHNLSLNASKLFETLIAMIKKDDKDFQEYFFYAKDFKELIESESNNVLADMIKFSKELLSKTIEVSFGKEILLTHRVISAKYEKSGGYIKYMLHPDLKPFLLNLRENYVSYKIENTLPLNSIYSFNLYPILKHKYNQCKPHTKNPFISFEMDLDEFKKTFQIPESYQLVHIKERILNKAKKELLEKTDIFFDYQLIKKCYKKFDTIIFTIAKNKH